jgi:hypothetical protein
MSHILSLVSLLLPGTLTAPAVADELPLLRDGIRSATWEIHFLDAPYQADITYSASGRFFILRGAKYLKVDAAGRETFSLARTAATFQPPFTHFIVEPEGLYDLSQPHPTRLPFVQVVNGEKDRQMSRDLWKWHFSRAYRKADIVLYRRSHGELHRVPAYMRIDGDWVIFYSAYDDIDLHHDYDLGASIEGYPPKFPRMTLLQDPQTGQFSAEASVVRHGEKPVPEQRLEYSLPGRFEWLSYQASMAIDHITHTNIPVSFTGPAEFQITLEGEALRFREAGVSSLLGRRESRMNWFVLSAELTDGAPVSFLEFRPYTNMDTLGSEGVYVIRHR